MTDLRYDVDIAGRGFLVSRRGGRFGRRSIPVQKAQQDTSELPGEQSLNPEDLWRRSFESWHRGAGQSSFDRSGSDPFRFDGSWGVDPWTQWQLGLLNETEAKLASTATSVKLVVAGGYLYCADGQTLKYTTSITAAGVASWTTVTGTPTADATAITSDGYNIWVAYGNEGIYTTTRGAAAATHYSTRPTSNLDYVKGRLMAAYGRVVSNYTEAPATAAGATAYNTTVGDADTEASISLYAVPTNANSRIIVIGWSDSLNTYSITPPSDWTLIGSDSTLAPAIQSAAYWAPADVTGPAVFEFSGTVESWAAVEIVSRTAFETDPINVYGLTALGTPATSIPSPSVTTTATKTRIISVVVGSDGAGAVATQPAGMGSPTQATSAGTLVTEVAVAGVYQAALGATGAKTWSFASNIDDSVAWTLAIQSEGPAPLTTHPSSDFTWVGFAEGQGDIYAAGYSGDKSLIYRTQVRADGTALDAPVVAGSLPDGEIVRSIYGYLGILFIGTDNGLRMAVSDANGDLTIGALITTASPVRCFEGQGRWVWFGLEDYDISRWSSGTLDGLGRLDLTQQTEQLVPAWASDLMVAASTSTTESVQSVVTFQDRRVFGIGSSNALTRGVYAEKANKVAAGYLDSGLITYGISDTKVATYLDLRHKALVGDLQVYLSTDEGSFTSIGTSTTASSTRPGTDPFPAGPTRGDSHEVRVRLNRASGSDAVGPTVTRMTLRAEPAPARGRVFQVPLILAKRLNVDGREVTRDPAADLAFLEALFDTQTLVTYREDATSVDVFVKDYEFVAEHRTDDGRMEQGVCTVTLKSPAS